MRQPYVCAKVILHKGFHSRQRPNKLASKESAGGTSDVVCSLPVLVYKAPSEKRDTS